MQTSLLAAYQDLLCLCERAGICPSGEKRAEMDGAREAIAHATPTTPEPYTNTNDGPMFRNLTAEEAAEFRQSAREDAIKAVVSLSKEIHHPVYRDEMQRCILRLAQHPVEAS